MSADIAVRLLADGDAVDEFDCGDQSLNSWLRRHALANAAIDSSRTYVAVTGVGGIAGYIALTAASIEHREASIELSLGMPRYPLPVVLLARLAVDLSAQNTGVGAMLMRFAMEVTVETAERIGVRGLAVDATDERVAQYYERLGLVRPQAGSLKLGVATAALRARLSGSG